MGEIKQGEAHAVVTSSSSASARVQRGEPSWTFLYVFVGFIVSFEGTMISMIEPIAWWHRLIAFAVVGAATVGTCLFVGPVQNQIVRMRGWYESKFY